jgi:hypothetical protein
MLTKLSAILFITSCLGTLSAQIPSPSPEKVAPQKVTVKEITFELLSCKVSPNGGKCEFRVENNSSENVNKEIYLCFPAERPGYFGCGRPSRMFDDLGNEYIATEGQVGSHHARRGGEVRIELPVRAPIKGWLKFENIDPEANLINLLIISYKVQGQNWFDAEIRKVPIAK